MHYLVKTVQETFPELLNFETELRFIEKAAIGKYNCKLVATFNTVKPVHVVTSIKQPPVLKGHLYLVLS
jgi:hypothetical protein